MTDESHHFRSSRPTSNFMKDVFHSIYFGICIEFSLCDTTTRRISIYLCQFVLITFTTAIYTPVQNALNLVPITSEDKSRFDCHQTDVQEMHFRGHYTLNYTHRLMGETTDKSVYQMKYVLSRKQINIEW